MKTLFASLVIAGLGSLVALQADVVDAHFHLDVAAHLGQTSLAPGDYKISVVGENTGMKHVQIDGRNGHAYGFPMPIERDAPVGSSTLQLVESNGNYFIKEYRSQMTGKIYAFSIPKNLHNVHTHAIQIAN